MNLADRGLAVVLGFAVLLWSLALGLFFTALTQLLFAYLLLQSQ